eukprot:scaffold85188_cov21-Tisochrysis_lutea.AAC.1
MHTPAHQQVVQTLRQGLHPLGVDDKGCGRLQQGQHLLHHTDGVQAGDGDDAAVETWRTEVKINQTGGVQAGDGEDAAAEAWRTEDISRAAG